MLNATRRPARRVAVAALIAAVATLPVVTTTPAAEAATADACGALLAKPTGGSWSCTFVDNFDGTKVNTAKWNLQDTAISGFRKGETCFKAGQNTAVGNGTLKLKVTRTALPFTCKSPYGNFQTRYLGADINGWGKFRQAYGRFEARLKYPAYVRAGYHGGFWMNPQDGVYGAWPNSGEIDIAEWWSAIPKQAYPSLHYAGRTKADTAWNCVIGRADVFHTYRVEWFSSVMRFYYDGNLCFSRSWLPDSPLSAPQPFDQRFFMSLTFGEGDSTSSTPFPGAMTVDYAKAWS